MEQGPLYMAAAQGNGSGQRMTLDVPFRAISYFTVRLTLSLPVGLTSS